MRRLHRVEDRGREVRLYVVLFYDISVVSTYRVEEGEVGHPTFLFDVVPRALSVAGSPRGFTECAAAARRARLKVVPAAGRTAGKSTTCSYRCLLIRAAA